MRRVAPLLAAAALLTAAPAAAQSGPSGPATAPVCGAGFPPYAPEPVAAGRTSTDVEIPMSDGVVLGATLTLPSGLDGPFPTALTITGYNRNGAAAVMGTGDLVSHGYATLLVDDRGTGSSGGHWDSWGERTLADYPEILDWIVAQPWSDGRVGATGTSYMGITALFTGATGHPALHGVFAIVPMGDAYRDITFAGGQVNAAFIPLWLGLVTAMSLAPVDDPATIGEHIVGTTEFQAPTVADAVSGGGTAYDGPFWRQRSPLEVLDGIEVPTFIVGGLDDLFQRGEPMLYERLVADGEDARLLIGPWSHVAAGTGAGLPADGVPVLGDLLLQWFDQHVKGVLAGAECIPPVSQFVRGPDRYVSAPSWPVPGLAAERWHLRGDGTLTLDAPTTDEPGRDYPQLPITTTCNRSTAQWLAGGIDATPCASDNSLDESTSLTWTSEAMTEPLAINGPIQADVWVRTTGTEAAVSVAVSDVAPDGTSRGLTNGLLLASHRAVDAARSRTLDGQSIQPWHPFTAEAQLPVPPGEAVHVPIEVFPTSATLEPGHRLRVTISAYDVPHALPPLPSLTESIGGITTVLAGPEHPTSVVLPVVKSAGAARGADTATAVPGAAPATPDAAAPTALARTGIADDVLIAVAAAVLTTGLVLRRRLRTL